MWEKQLSLAGDQSVAKLRQEKNIKLLSFDAEFYTESADICRIIAMVGQKRNCCLCSTYAYIRVFRWTVRRRWSRWCSRRRSRSTAASTCRAWRTTTAAHGILPQTPISPSSRWWFRMVTVPCSASGSPDHWRCVRIRNSDSWPFWSKIFDFWRKVQYIFLYWFLKWKLSFLRFQINFSDFRFPISEFKNSFWLHSWYVFLNFLLVFNLISIIEIRCAGCDAVADDCRLVSRNVRHPLRSRLPLYVLLQERQTPDQRHWREFDRHHGTAGHGKDAQLPVLHSHAESRRTSGGVSAIF